MMQPRDLDALLVQLARDKARYDAAMLAARIATEEQRLAIERRFMEANPHAMKAT